MMTAAGRVVVPLLLSVLTLGVFWRLQNFGPEGAVLDFHRALVRSDLLRLEQLSLEGGGPWVAWYVENVGPLVREADGIRVEQLERAPRMALVLSTLYRGNWRLSTPWEVALVRGRWRVQAIRVPPPYNVRGVPGFP
ncbi:MAG: hypothetical protein N2109_02450 [Fimbriimonadales bacterium]|nr:hypothetical protein [Fimbriimonadales bacterium]